MWHVLKGQGRSSQTYRVAATGEYSCLKVGRHQYGFHRGSSFDYPQVWFHLADCWSIHEVCPLHSCLYLLQGQEIHRVVHWAQSMSTWGAQHHHLWPRSSVHCSFLGAATRFSMYSPDPQFGLSPVDWWLDRACEPSARRHAMCMCEELSGNMGLDHYSWRMCTTSAECNSCMWYIMHYYFSNGTP
jgi:hypothetical protein